MKPEPAKYSKPPARPVLQKAPHPAPVPPVTATPPAKPAKRDNIFSKSRDIREDRGTRQAKNAGPHTPPPTR
jgi:hypothetical protein